MTVDLTGVRVIVTRPEAQAATLQRRLRAAGAEAILLPAIEIAAIEPNPTRDAALERLDTCQWAVFTSVNAVRHGLPGARAQPPRLQVAAVGRKTAAALEERGWRVDLLPERRDAEGVATALTARVGVGDRVYFPRAAAGREVLPNALTAAGAQVDLVAVYETRPTVIPAATMEGLAAEPPHACIFTSPSGVASLVTAFTAAGTPFPATTRCIAIGRTTAAALDAHGLPCAAVAREPSDAGLVAAVARGVLS